MVDMAKVHGLEEAKREVMKAWTDATKELDDITKRQGEITDRYIASPRSSSERYDLEEELRIVHTEWAVSYGKVQMCSQLANKLDDMIDAEYEVDKETA